MNIIFSILLSNIITTIQSSLITKTQVLAKKTRSGTRGMTQIDPTASFHQYLQTTDVYVDKTLFVKYVMENSNSMVITAPRRWGKSLLTKMLEFFLQAEVDKYGEIVPQSRTKSYKFFTAGQVQHEQNLADDFDSPPLISSYNEFIENNLAKFPVIRVDFSYLSGARNFIVFLEYFKTLLSKIFFKYTTPVKNLCLRSTNAYGKSVPKDTCSAEDLRHFYNIHGEKNSTQSDLQFSLQFLSKILASCYDNKVVIIIDEFDKILNIMLTIRKSVIPEEDKILVEEFYMNFLRSSIVTNEYTYRAIVNGIYPVSLDDNVTTSNLTYMRYLDAELYPYYGFTRQEVDIIMNYYNISQEMVNEVIALYDGYQINNMYDTRVVHPLAIVKFIHYRNLDYYWITDSPLSEEALRTTNNQHILLKLRAHRCLLHDPVNSINLSDYLGLETRAIKENCDKMKNLQDFLMVLDIEGYLNTVHYGNSPYCLKLPNVEITYKINLILFGIATFYQYEPAAAHAIAELLENTSNDMHKLLANYKNMLQFRYKERHAKITNKEVYHRFRFFDILHEASILYNYTVTISPSENPIDPHLSIYNNSSGVIILVRYNYDDSGIKSDIIKKLWPRAKAHFTNHRETKSLKLIIVNVDEERNLKYVDYSFARLEDIPNVGIVSQFSADIKSI